MACPPTRTTRAALALALAAAAALGDGGAPALADARAVTPVKTWSGRVPQGVPPPLLPTVTTPQALAQVWALCQVKGEIPAVDFKRHFVLVAARRSSVVRVRDLKVDDGHLKTSVVVAPDMPSHSTCALALVARDGITRVDGMPVDR